MVCLSVTGRQPLETLRLLTAYQEQLVGDDALGSFYYLVPLATGEALPRGPACGGLGYAIFAPTVLAPLPVGTAYQGESFFALGAATGGKELPQKSAPAINMVEVIEPQVSRYPAYKPTGVEWMPEIPVGWEMRKVGHSFRTIDSGTTPNTDKDLY